MPQRRVRGHMAHEPSTDPGCSRPKYSELHDILALQYVLLRCRIADSTDVTSSEQCLVAVAECPQPMWRTSQTVKHSMSASRQSHCLGIWRTCHPVCCRPSCYAMSRLMRQPECNNTRSSSLWKHGHCMLAWIDYVHAGSQSVAQRIVDMLLGWRRPHL